MAGYWPTVLFLARPLTEQAWSIKDLLVRQQTAKGKDYILILKRKQSTAHKVS